MNRIHFGLARRMLLLVPPAVVVSAVDVSAQGLPKIEREFANGGSARFYGQVNKGFLNYDDGEVRKTYNLIDNDNSSTRIGFTYGIPLGEEWDLGSRIEFEYQPFNTGEANVLDNNFDNSIDLEDTLRWAEFTFANERIGKFSLGQGSMASDGTSEVDKSGTGVIAYSSVGDTAGGQILRQSDGELSDRTIGGSFTNYDGLGRQMRVRYDTRDFNGFSLAASYGQNVLANNDDNLYDVAAFYGNEWETFELAGAVAYSWKGSDTTILNASASGLHTPTGLNLTVAGGTQDADSVDGNFGYVKLGWIAEWWNGGDSKFAVDFYDGSKVVNDSSSSESYSLSYVQEIDRANTQFWVTARQYKYDDDEADYDDGQAYFAGLRFSW